MKEKWSRGQIKDSVLAVAFAKVFVKETEQNIYRRRRRRKERGYYRSARVERKTAELALK